jgi:hypothetical protein
MEAMPPCPRSKVLGVGLNKTGTTTLGACLKQLGYRHVTWDRDAFELWRAGRIEDVLERMDAWDSFEDWPWPLVYRELDRRHPDARFVLTVRKDADSWFESLRKHAERTGPTVFREAIYGHAMPHGRRDEHVAIYARHNAEVRAWFRGRPGKLLEVCWERGDGWDALAPFLGHGVPAAAFPHLNRSPAA